VWAGPGRNDATLNVFFDQLGPERSALLTHVSVDMADWIARVVARRAPNAIRSADPFHVVAWAIDALDIERRRGGNDAKGRIRDVRHEEAEERCGRGTRPIGRRRVGSRRYGVAVGSRVGVGAPDRPAEAAARRMTHDP